MTSATMTEEFRGVLENIQSDKNHVKFELPREELTLQNVFQFSIKYTERD
jgi:hypothetical protein